MAPRDNRQELEDANIGHSSSNVTSIEEEVARYRVEVIVEYQ
jgi:hypothetical protein